MLIGKKHWDPQWSLVVPVLIEAPIPPLEDRLDLLRSALSSDVTGGNGHLNELTTAASGFRLNAPPTAARSSVRTLAGARRGTPARSGRRPRWCWAQNAAGLERVARRVVPHTDWTDIVLPLDAKDLLSELAIRARHREQILDVWGVGGRSARGRGITALFAGK